ncbi:ABC-2 type transport system permease protein/oleandomycin transport system permease protein [Streptacidiphilus jiangxiensis]|uniref:Transport permease protein n=2 Tax=Streptacidiphilus jiangxiensis TaxID=235985 RepID=A0A1H7M7D3_STRJI|nr:ABC-2 type transport system permease protein/oleandomycin transport system permease protein [Streptacidiphilus jiangxiensis]
MATMTITSGTAPAKRRVGVLAGLEHTATLAWRNLVQIKHNPMELMDLSIQPVMFLLLFTYVFGGQMSGSTHAYLNFALAGIIVQNGLFATLSTAVGLNNDIQKGVFDRLRSLPIARSAPLAGRVAADLVKQLWSMLLMLGIGVALGFRPHSAVGVLGAAALMLVFALAMSWLSVLIGMLASSPEKVQMMAFVVMFPLTFSSSAFVSPSTMPGWMQAWVKVNPVTSLVDAMRALLDGGPLAASLTHTLLWAAALAAVFFPLALRAYQRRT